MTEGFKKPDGKGGHKFIPTGNNSHGLSKDAVVIKFDTPINFDDAEILRMEKKNRLPKLQIKEVFTIDELSDSAKEKALEKLRQSEYEFSDDFFADYDGLIYDEKSELSDYDVFDNYTKKYYDLDRGQYIQFPDLVVNNEAKLGMMLGLPQSLVDNINFSFVSNRENNTQIEFHDLLTGDTLNFSRQDPSEYFADYKKYTDKDDKTLTKKDFELLARASEKWDDMMHNAWKSLRDSYEYQFTDEALLEKAEYNGYEFDSEGNLL